MVLCTGRWGISGQFPCWSCWDTRTHLCSAAHTRVALLWGVGCPSSGVMGVLSDLPFVLEWTSLDSAHRDPHTPKEQEQMRPGLHRGLFTELVEGHFLHIPRAAASHTITSDSGGRTQTPLGGGLFSVNAFCVSCECRSGKKRHTVE